ncbi:MAG: DMT family transporter, partial [Tepidisphaeraceae bacterium]
IMTHEQSVQVGQLLALATAFSWTLGSLAFENASRRVGSVPVNLIRMVIAFCLLSLHCLIFRGRLLPTDAPVQAWRWLLLSGAIGFFIGDLALFRAFVEIGARLSQLLMTLAPAVAAICGVALLGERVGARGWLGISVTLGGVVLVVTQRVPSHANHHRITTKGLMLGIVAAFGQGLGVVAMQPALAVFDQPFAATQIRAIAGIAAFATLVALRRDFRRVGLAARNPAAMAFITLGAIAGPYLGVSMLASSLSHGVTTGVASTIASLVPVMIIPFAIVLKHEHVTWRGWIGAIVAVAGVGILMLG